MGMFDGMEISASGAHRRAPADERHGGEPRQRADHRGADGKPYRRKEVVLQAVGQAAASAPSSPRRWARSGVAPGGVQVTAITEDQTHGKLVYDPEPPGRRRAGLRAHAERRHGDRDGRPDRLLARLEANVTAM